MLTYRLWSFLVQLSALPEFMARTGGPGTNPADTQHVPAPACPLQHTLLCVTSSCRDQRVVLGLASCLRVFKPESLGLKARGVQSKRHLPCVSLGRWQVRYERGQGSAGSACPRFRKGGGGVAQEMPAGALVTAADLALKGMEVTRSSRQTQPCVPPSSLGSGRIRNSGLTSVALHHPSASLLMFILGILFR